MKSVPTLPALAVCSLFALLSSGCASSDAQVPAAGTRVERVEPVTGTNIPRRPAAPTPSDAERGKVGERAKEPAAGGPPRS